MKNLTIPSKIYILGTILIGLLVLLGDVLPLKSDTLLAAMGLSAIASLSLILKVEGSTSRSHYNISFVIYAFSFVILGPEETMLVILVANLAEWIWFKYPWYIPSFNIFSHILVLHLAGMAYRWVYSGTDFQHWQSIAGILLSMAIFTFFNHLMVGLVIWLARGENFGKSGVFEFLPLMLDFTLLCMGAMAAIVWRLNPFAVILFLLPLYPIYSTLKVPALERKTETNSKTGLFNATYFEQALVSELKRADRFDRPLTVVMADLDLLRNINNTYGHLAGDEVLKGIANILRNSVREYDIVARFGGEEFSILMPETTPQQAYPRIEAIRKAVERADFMVPTSVTPIRATMSFGISGRQGNMNSPQEIIHNADTSLYHAKLKGRNGTFIYSEEGIYNLFSQWQEEYPDETGDAMDKILPEARSLQGDALTDAHPVDTTDAEEIPVKEINPPRKHPRWVVLTFISCLTALAVMGFVLTYDPEWKVEWIGVAIFAIMVILTELLSIDIYDSRGTAVSTSTVPMLAGVLLFGPLAALLLSLTLAAVALIKYRSPFNRFMFNVSNQLIAAVIYLAVIGTTGVVFINQPPLYQFLLSLTAVGITFVVTTSLISIGVGLDVNTSVKTVWVEKFSWLPPYYLAMGLIAYALIFSYQTAGLLGTLITLIPLLLLRFSQMQYIDRTKLVVQEIREKNTALQRSSFEIQRLNDGLMDTLAEVVDLRDPNVLGHSKQVAHYAVLMAKKLGLHSQQVDMVRKAGLLHDIGKLGVSESILFKPGRLTSSELEIVRQHSLLGAELLENSYSLKELIPIIRHHHEHYDGRGYPDGVNGADIPMESRILAVADAVEAMASDRPYRRGMNAQEILDELNRNSGTQFDPLVVKAFIQVVRSNQNLAFVNSARHVEEEDHSPSPKFRGQKTLAELK